MNAPASFRPPAVAGMFYPGPPGELRRDVSGFLEKAPAPWGRVRGLIAPHAGYVYSGALAGRVYAGVGAAPKRVWLLGPSHHVPLAALTGCTAAAWRTPLGDVPVDQEILEQARRAGQLVMDDGAHAPEHSLETHLPFIQTRFPGVSVLPLLTPARDDPALAETLHAMLGEHDLLAVSSDLSHFLSDADARRTDAETATALEAGQLSTLCSRRACGWVAVRTLMRLAVLRRWRVKRVGLLTSADAGGSRDRVVGYGGWWFLDKDGGE